MQRLKQVPQQTMKAAKINFLVTLELQNKSVKYSLQRLQSNNRQCWLQKLTFEFVTTDKLVKYFNSSSNRCNCIIDNSGCKSLLLSFTNDRSIYRIFKVSLQQLQLQSYQWRLKILNIKITSYNLSFARRKQICFPECDAVRSLCQGHTFLQFDTV